MELYLDGRQGYNQYSFCHFISTIYNSLPINENGKKVNNFKLAQSKQEVCTANKFETGLYKTDFENARRSIFGTPINLNEL